MKITAAAAILKVLREQGTEVIFGYPGAANTPLYDCIPKSGLRCVLTRNEQAAAHAAGSSYKLTGKVGVCTATSGPGATNLLTGIANAYMDSIPLVAITGQVSTSQVGTDSFQEVDFTGVTTPVTKHNFLVKNADEVPSVIRKAFYIAGTGRPGPVVVDVPLDVLTKKINFYEENIISIRGYQPEHLPKEQQLCTLAQMMRASERPLIIAGGGVPGSGCDFTRFAENCAVPVVSTMMGITSLPSKHGQYLGMAGWYGTKAAEYALTHADFVMFLGARVSDRTIANPAELAQRAKIAHIDIDPAEINKNIDCDIGIAANVKTVLPALERLLDGWHADKNWLAACMAYRREDFALNARTSDKIHPKYFMQILSEETDENAIIVTEVGQNQIWTANHYAFQSSNTFLTSGGFGTMGYGLPAAIGAKILRPDLTVIAVEGDGSLQMTLAELATLKQANAALKIVLMKNRTLGMVRELQKKHYRSNFVSVDLGKYPNFQKIAEAYDISFRSISHAGEVTAAVREMLAAKNAFLLEVCIDESETTI